MPKTPKKNGLEFYSAMFPSGDALTRKRKLVQLYKKEYRWRIYKQGRIIAASSEGYSRLQGAANNIKSIVNEFTNAANDALIKRTIDAAIANFKNKKK